MKIRMTTYQILHSSHSKTIHDIREIDNPFTQTRGFRSFLTKIIESELERGFEVSFVRISK